MAISLHPSAPRNGACATVAAGPGDPAGILPIFDAYTNEHGHFWCSTNNEGTGALNVATGKKHPTLVASRRWLKRHGVIELVPKAVLRAIYAESTAKAPPDHVQVWRITGWVKPCELPKCKCTGFLHQPVKLLNIGDGGPDVIPSASKNPVQESLEDSKGNGSKDLTTLTGAGAVPPPDGDGKPAKAKKAKPESIAILDPRGIPINNKHPRFNPIWDAMKLVTKLDTSIPANGKNMGGAVKALLQSEIEYQAADILHAAEWWKAKEWDGDPTVNGIVKWIGQIHASRLEADASKPAGGQYGMEVTPELLKAWEAELFPEGTFDD